jgi:hypothetical protein
MDGKTTPNGTLLGLVGDMAELLARAFFGGLAAAVAMGAAILVLSTGAQAQPFSASYPPLGAIVATSASFDEPRSAAPTPAAGRKSAGAGALWAGTQHAETGDLVQALGLLALLSAGAVAVVARRIDRTRDSTKT